MLSLKTNIEIKTSENRFKKFLHSCLGGCLGALAGVLMPLAEWLMNIRDKTKEENRANQLRWPAILDMGASAVVAYGAVVRFGGPALWCICLVECGLCIYGFIRGIQISQQSIILDIPKKLWNDETQNDKTQNDETQFEKNEVKVNKHNSKFLHASKSSMLDPVVQKASLLSVIRGGVYGVAAGLLMPFVQSYHFILSSKRRWPYLINNGVLTYYALYVGSLYIGPEVSLLLLKSMGIALSGYGLIRGGYIGYKKMPSKVFALMWQGGFAHEFHYELDKNQPYTQTNTSLLIEIKEEKECMKPTFEMQSALYLKQLELEIEHEQNKIKSENRGSTRPIYKWHSDRTKRLEAFKKYIEDQTLIVDENERFKPRRIDFDLQYKTELSCEGTGGLLPYFPAEIFSIFAKKGAESNFIECIKIYLDAFSLKKLISFIAEQDKSFIDLCGGLFLLFSAQSGDYMELMKLLLKREVSPNATFLGEERASPLQVLCSLMIFNEYGAQDFTVCFNLLIEHGAEINYQNKCGDTALMWVTEPSKFNPGFKLLLDAGVNLWLENNKNESAVSRVLYHNNDKEDLCKIKKEMLVQLEDANIKRNNLAKSDIMDTTKIPKTLMNLVWSYRDYEEYDDFQNCLMKVRSKQRFF